MPGNCAQRPKPVPNADTPAPYSTDDTAAMAIIRYLKSKNIGVEIVALPDESEVEVWSLHNTGEIYEHYTDVYGKTIPHALSLLILEEKQNEYI